MFSLSDSKKTSGSSRIDGVPEGLAHTADEATQRVTNAFETVSARAAKTANVAADRAAQLSDLVGNANIEVKVPKLPARRRARPRAKRMLPGDRSRLIGRLRHADEAWLKTQLAKTSRELASESADLGKAVESLNGVIRANRRAGAAKRTRLFLGLAAGAALMYHLDPKNGRERRAATVGTLKRRQLRGSGVTPNLS